VSPFPILNASVVLYLYSTKETPMLAIRLPEDIEERLNALADETGRTKTALAREAILEYIDDLEDYYLAEARARRNRKTIPLAEVERELGL
jgi:RHH-type rel operon transcriptional repressor/antitoxin RelB